MLEDWPAVTEISAVESAFVPVMKTVISGVEVDLLFARVNLAEAGDKLDIERDEILRGVDDASQRSLNGPRVTDMMLSLVPDVDTFRDSLRTIRLWAKRRGIYSNLLGFPGGVAWALMTARICQLYPTASASTVVAKFFPIYYQWRWPDPVILKKIEQGPPNMQHSVWNPRVDRRDQAHRMPIITPAYPSMCATHNITQSTMQVIRTEMLRAMQICDRVLLTPGSTWVELFDRVDFFSLYKTYVQVIASASSADKIKDWGGTVEHRIRTLVQDLENTDIILLAHPSMHSISSTFICLTDEEQAAASQGELTVEAMQRKEEDFVGQEYKKVYTKSFFIGLDIEKKPKDSAGGRVLNLFYPSKRFCASCQQWDKYDEMEMSVILRPAKRTDLPFYCFPDGQPKSKKKGKRGQQPSIGDTAGLETVDGQGPSKRSRSTVDSDDVPGTNGLHSLDEPPSDPSDQVANPTAPAIVSAGSSAVATANGNGNSAPMSADIAPPPAIQGMPPLSTTAMSSFASAEKGVVGVDGPNPNGLIQLAGADGVNGNGAAAST